MWLSSNSPEADTVPLILLVYARILYELAELNEGRVARELIRFLDQVCDRVLDGDGPPRRPRLPLGQLKLAAEPGQPAIRSYQAEFYEFAAGGFRLDFQGSMGKRASTCPGPSWPCCNPAWTAWGRRPAPPDPGAGAPPPLLPLSPGFLGRRGAHLRPIFALGTEEIRPKRHPGGVRAVSFQRQRQQNQAPAPPPSSNLSYLKS